MSMCRVFCVVGRGCLLWSVGSLGKTLLAFALLHFALQGQGQTTCYARYPLTSLTSYSCIPVPCGEKSISIVVLVLDGLGSLHKTVQLNFSGSCVWGMDLDYYDVEWFALEMNWDHSVIFETAPKYCILDSFVDSEGYSISCKGFWAMCIAIMVIWIKFAHSCPF